jgi:hypothetical protein
MRLGIYLTNKTWHKLTKLDIIPLKKMEGNYGKKRISNRN